MPSADIITNEEWTFQELQAEAEDLRKRLNRFRTSLGRFFVASFSPTEVSEYISPLTCVKSSLFGSGQI